MDITIYSTSSCTGCDSLVGWLKTQNIAYTKKVTDTDPAIMTEFMEANEGMIGVPFTVISDASGKVVAKISGYDQPKFKQVLGLS